MSGQSRGPGTRVSIAIKEESSCSKKSVSRILSRRNCQAVDGRKNAWNSLQVVAGPRTQELASVAAPRPCCKSSPIHSSLGRKNVVSHHHHLFIQAWGKSTSVIRKRSAMFILLCIFINLPYTGKMQKNKNSIYHLVYYVNIIFCK